jgi:hypothetical protein
VNPCGHVTGWAATATAEHAIAWTKKDGIVDLNDRVPELPLLKVRK